MAALLLEVVAGKGASVAVGAELGTLSSASAYASLPVVDVDARFEFAPSSCLSFSFAPPSCGVASLSLLASARGGVVVIRSRDVYAVSTR